MVAGVESVAAGVFEMFDQNAGTAASEILDVVYLEEQWVVPVLGQVRVQTLASSPALLDVVSPYMSTAERSPGYPFYYSC